MLNIMIIDSNLTFGQMLADFLKTKTLSSVMRLHGSCPDLMDQFSLFAPDIVFMDIQSLGKACLEVTRSFKASRPGLCMIWLTSCDQPEYTQQARNSGINYCLSKNAITMGGITDLIRVIRHTGRIR